jgi:hypothetical protein
MFSQSSIFVIVICICLALYRHYGDARYRHDIQVIYNRDEVDVHLSKYKALIGNDYDGYRNHIYRVLTFAMHFLDNNEKYLPLISYALVYHDIGLWTDNTLSYLDPSSAKAMEGVPSKFSQEEKQLIHEIIYYHHKLTSYRNNNKLFEKIVEATLAADWIDATMGLVSSGIPTRHIRKVQNTIAEEGFHQTLLDFGPRLHGNDFMTIIINLSKIITF